MNPVFVFIVILGAFVLWVLCSCLFRLIGAIIGHFVNKTMKAMGDEPSGAESFVSGFKSAFKKGKGESKE